MSYILSLLCCCCPCLKKQRRRTRKRKTTKTTDPDSEKVKINSEKWEQNSLLTPSQINEKDLTKIFLIPEQYTTLDECMSGQGVVIYKNDVLGEGGGGKVFKAFDIERDLEMACKDIELSLDTLIIRDEPRFNALRNELFVMTKAKRHPNLIQLFKHFIVEDLNRNKQNCYIFMELANGGNLLQKIFANNANTEQINTKGKGLTEKVAKYYFKQIVEGLLFLHSNGIAHKDLKLSNILIVKEKGKEVVKISDFGVSRVRFDGTNMIKDISSGYGGPEFMSPQVFKLYIYENFKKKVWKLRQYDSFKADCWALGVVLYVIICGSYPFVISRDHPFEAYEQMYNTMKKKTNRYEISEYTKSHYSSDCLTLIEELIEPDVCKRLTIILVKEHPWLIHNNYKSP